MPGPRVEESKHLLVVLHRPAKDNLRRSTRALLLRTQEQRHDLGGSEVPAGEEAIFEFVADETGTFEVESHVTGEVLMVLVVE